MKITITFTIALCLLLSHNSFSQEQRFNALQVSFDFGFANDIGQLSTYSPWINNELINVDKRSFAFANNFAISYSRYFDDTQGFEMLFGYTKYGFGFEGTFSNSKDFIQGSFSVRHLEWGLLYLYKIPLSSTANLLIKPGILYHWDASPSSYTIGFSHKDSFSLSSYLGYEIPIVSDRIFANLGVQIKFPLQAYNSDFRGDPGLFPFFMGLRVGFNYQF